MLFMALSAFINKIQFWSFASIHAAWSHFFKRQIAKYTLLCMLSTLCCYRNYLINAVVKPTWAPTWSFQSSYLSCQVFQEYHYVEDQVMSFGHNFQFLHIQKTQLVKRSDYYLTTLQELYYQLISSTSQHHSICIFQCCHAQSPFLAG